MLEIFIVIGGGLYFLLWALYDLFKDSRFRAGKNAMKHFAKRIIDDELEDTIDRFVRNNDRKPEKIFELVSDNLIAIYGYDYDKKIARTSNGAVDPTELWYLKCLIMSKNGCVPNKFYWDGVTIFYKFPRDNKDAVKTAMAYVSQIQKNLDSAGAGVQLVYVYTDIHLPYYNLTTKWKHDYLIPYMKYEIRKVKYK